ncbi:uncharacterized protein LOC128386209 [Panonychus citri]|uniref:uncharacterized protein LOC128386209 n=1 Tax=Panonychus citri TaxID=50023 RepID=UPI002308280B|nr:uncharacterized protein LOC128386209 [Panonychus citri]
MSHQRAPGFGRPPQTPSNVNNLNISGFWSKATNSNFLTNPFTYPTGNQFNENTATNSNVNNIWRQSATNSTANPSNSRSIGTSVAISPSTSSTYTYSPPPLINLNNNRAKLSSSSPFPSQPSRSHCPTTNDLILAQLMSLCLDNQQSISIDNLNSLSSSSSHGSCKLIDPIGTSLDQSNNLSLRKLKARTEDSFNSNITSDLQYNHPTIPIATNSQNGNGRRKHRRGSCLECVFCKNNGQPASFYQNHVLKDVLGRVTCPILFAYDCPICHNGGGPKAHTVRYCPQNKPSNRLRNALLKSQTLLNNNQSIM